MEQGPLDVTAKYRREIMGAHLLMVEGRVQRSAKGIVHIMAETLTNHTADMHRLSE